MEGFLCREYQGSLAEHQDEQSCARSYRLTCWSGSTSDICGNHTSLKLVERTVGFYLVYPLNSKHGCYAQLQHFVCSWAPAFGIEVRKIFTMIPLDLLKFEMIARSCLCLLYVLQRVLSPSACYSAIWGYIREDHCQSILILLPHCRFCGRARRAAVRVPLESRELVPNWGKRPRSHHKQDDKATSTILRLTSNI